MLSASTKIEKRSGGTKRAAKFIIHHPLEDKEWYLWCHKPKLPQPIIDFKPGSDKNPFFNFANALKEDKPTKDKQKGMKPKKKETKMSADLKHKSQGNNNSNGMKSGKTLHSKGATHKMNGNAKKANSGNAMWPFQYLSNLNPNLNKGHSPPPSTDAWNPKPGLKLEPKGTVTVDDSDDSDDGKEEEKGGRHEAQEWCDLLNEVCGWLALWLCIYCVLCPSL